MDCTDLAQRAEAALTHARKVHAYARGFGIGPWAEIAANRSAMHAYVEAADAYLVAADAFEESGAHDLALMATRTTRALLRVAQHAIQWSSERLQNEGLVSEAEAALRASVDLGWRIEDLTARRRE